MENSQMMMKGRLEFFGIIKEIPIKNFSFIFIILLTCFPLFCFSCLHETILHQALIESLKSLAHDHFPRWFLLIYRSSDFTLDVFIEWLSKFISQKLILQSLVLLPIIHLLDLLNIIITVTTASVIYAEENKIFSIPFIKNKIAALPFKGILVTSIYVLLLNLIAFLGLLCFSINIYVTLFSFFKLVHGLLLVGLFIKYLEWSAIWNMGIVISILEENKHGDVALVVSAYLTRGGSRKSGFLIMLVFFAWSLGLRLSSLYICWHKGNVLIEAIVVQLCLYCVRNVMKWVTFMIYFYDCRRRFLENKLDESAEAGA